MNNERFGCQNNCLVENDWKMIGNLNQFYISAKNNRYSHAKAMAVAVKIEPFLARVSLITSTERHIDPYL